MKGLALRGYVATTFKDLCNAFGDPGSMLEVSAEWEVTFEDGTAARIHNYKNSALPEHLYLWYIGSRTTLAVQRVAEVLRTDCYLPANSRREAADTDEIPF